MTRKNTQHVNRRDILRATCGAIIVGGVGPSIAGVAVADDVDQRFITVGTPAAESRIEDEGYDVMHSLADGGVLIVVGSDGDQADLGDITGVQHVVPDVNVRYTDVRVDSDTASESSDGGAETESEDPVFGNLQWDKRLMDVQKAHETATGDGVRVAIIDTGIESGHTDLDPNLNEDLSVRFKNGEMVRQGDPHDARPGGHGTQVAGIVAASGVGVVGVAPDAELVSINIFQDDLPVGEWTVVDLLVSLEYAREIAADVVNMSLLSVGAPSDSRTSADIDHGGLRAAIERLTNMLAREGIVMAAAAGNFGADLQTGGAWWFPGGQHGVLNVSATGPNDKLVYYSNYGTRWIDVAAPGGGYETVEKTLCTQDGLIIGCEDEDDEPPENLDDLVDDCECEPGDLPFPFNWVWSTWFSNGTPAVATFAGTSAAAPQVAGIAALVQEANPDLNARQVEQVIKESAELVDGQDDAEFGAGRVNAAIAVDEATK